MLQINRVQIKIETNKGTMGADHAFKKGLNLIYSSENTSGKSSIISAIYYGLGFEEIIGGKGPKVLGPAFKNKIKHENTEQDVLESKIFLEISNGKKTITIFRSVQMENRDSNLITVYHSDLESISTATKEDMYAHLQYSAMREKGFFTFLEKFIGFTLPSVPTNTEVDRKLYLQLVFSSMLIEQKHGWADILSGMPHFGIKEAKKRVIEYILNLDIFEIIKSRIKLKQKKERLQMSWENEYKYYISKLDENSLQFIGIPKKVQLINEEDLDIIYVYNEEKITLLDYIGRLEKEESSLVNIQRKNNIDFDELSNELKEIQQEILIAEKRLGNANTLLLREVDSISNLKDSLELIKKDIVNNKDAKRLQKIGSNEDFDIFKNRCPTCEQELEDSVLISQNLSPVMSIDQNIIHLESQKETFEFIIKQKEESINLISSEIKEFQQAKDKLILLANIINNDLYALDGTYSESTVLKKVLLKQKIQVLKNLLDQTQNIYSIFIKLSNLWRVNLEGIKKIPKSNLTKNDIAKLDSLRDSFVKNLYNFGYKSNVDDKMIQISEDTYLPLVKNFDMKFDSSASDHIRGIWAFTIALLQTAQLYDAAHSNLIIFDEPGQHSIIIEDIRALFDTLNGLKGQFILGITANDENIKTLIIEEENRGVNTIEIDDWAFTMFT